MDIIAAARQCMEYADGARQVVDACRGTSPALESLFDEAYAMCAERFSTAPVAVM